MRRRILAVLWGWTSAHSALSSGRQRPQRMRPWCSGMFSCLLITALLLHLWELSNRRLRCASSWDVPNGLRNNWKMKWPRADGTVWAAVPIPFSASFPRMRGSPCSTEPSRGPWWSTSHCLFRSVHIFFTSPFRRAEDWTPEKPGHSHMDASLKKGANLCRARQNTFMSAILQDSNSPSSTSSIVHLRRLHCRARGLGHRLQQRTARRSRGSGQPARTPPAQIGRDSESLGRQATSLRKSCGKLAWT
jgi:hypothetical protein